MKERLRNVIENIEIERLKYSSHHIIKLVAVSKYASLEQIITIYNAGQRAFGENKVQDFKDKSQQSQNLPIEWHFIGHLQENKVNQLLSLKPFLFQALDSIKLANTLQKKLASSNQTLRCLLEINSSLESTKGGFLAESAVESYKQIQDSCPNIKLKGVMTIAANVSDVKTIDLCFRKTRDIFDKLQSISDDVEILSMGMSGDYKIAIANGANMVRIGSDIFK